MDIWKNLMVPFSSFFGFIVQIYVKISKRNIIIQDPSGFKFQLQPGDEIAFYYKRKSVTDATNIIKFIRQYVQKNWVCVDIGANKGAVSMPLWQMVGTKEGKVISIEPDPNNIGKIKTNFSLNNIPDWYIENVALSNQEGETELRIYPKCNGWQTMGNPSFAADYESYLVRVPTTRFDTLMNTLNIETIQFVKIDTEGAELLVLEGMRDYLHKKSIKCVIYEVNPLMLEGMKITVTQLMSFWNDLSYDLYILSSTGTINPLKGEWPEHLIGDCIAIVKEN